MRAATVAVLVPVAVAAMAPAAHASWTTREAGSVHLRTAAFSPVAAPVLAGAELSWQPVHLGTRAVTSYVVTAVSDDGSTTLVPCVLSGTAPVTCELPDDLSMGHRFSVRPRYRGWVGPASPLSDLTDPVTSMPSSTADSAPAPTVAPSAEPTAEPMAEPTPERTVEPTIEPTVEPAGT